MNILMPQLGETVTEGTVLSWSKAVGDAVASGDVLFEIETDKTTMEIPATCDGVLTEIIVEAGTLVEVGTVVAVLQESAAAAEEAPAAKVVDAPAAAGAAASSAPRDPYQAVVTPAQNYGRGRLDNGTEVTPLALRLAAEAQLKIASLSGSGPGGRIVGRDVGTKSAPKPDAGSSLGAPSALQAQYAGAPHVVIPLSGMRKTIARRLTESVQTIPHFYLSVAVQLEELNALRAATNAAGGKGASPVKLSVNDFVVKALATALTKVPTANVIWAEDRMLQFKHADIGIAVAIDGGLITPVIREVDKKTIFAVSTETKNLATRARDHKLQPAEYQGGSIAVSNLGMFGVQQFAAIINPPQSAILAVGAASPVAEAVAGGGVRFVSQMIATLACDHRAIDGALGAQLLSAFKAAMESPAGLMK